MNVIPLFVSPQLRSTKPPEINFFEIQYYILYQFQSEALKRLLLLLMLLSRSVPFQRCILAVLAQIYIDENVFAIYFCTPIRWICVWVNQIDWYLLLYVMLSVLVATKHKKSAHRISERKIWLESRADTFLFFLPSIAKIF